MDTRNWADLNTDCLINIFARVGNTTTLIRSLQFVCKSWFCATCDPSCWETLTFSDPCYWETNNFESTCSPHYVKYAVERSQGLATSVTFQSNCLAHGHQSLHYVAEGCPLLKVLDLGYVSWFSDGKLGSILISCMPKWKNLEMLKMAGCNYIKTLEKFRLKCKNLDQLDCTNSQFHNAEIEVIGISWASLKFIEIYNHRMCRQHLVAELTLCKDLQYVDVSCGIGFLVDNEKYGFGTQNNYFDFGWHEEYDYIARYHGCETSNDRCTLSHTSSIGGWSSDECTLSTSWGQYEAPFVLKRYFGLFKDAFFFLVRYLSLFKDAFCC